jgi:ATP-dependent Clp protease ATP-binding subunit ClpB
MNFDQYTDKSKSIVQQAQTRAVSKGHQKFMLVHVLDTMLDDGEGIIRDIINTAGGDLSKIESELEKALDKLPSVTGSGSGQIYLDTDTAKMFDEADKIAKNAGDSFVTIERLLQAIMSIKGNDAYKILTSGGLETSKLNAAIDEMRKGRTADTQHAEEGFDALKKYAKDLTEQARRGKLDPVIGRDEEIRRAMQVLSRRTKNNPVLIGEPGVGKTAIAEGLAQRIVTGDAPENLKNQKLLVLD